ncbi:fimbrial biogenesis chaperone [Chitinophaga ginsengisoli]|uniref:Pili/flagellar assembly PapD-like chaperone n=1 Tax=Chitinophaga ginsengisoli TaxID=363837 RepID=A0A2P8GL88_9BACT|nr:fimbria/pilus periplasmic chaperone [Chitinophaga ginsengisoli]PSL34710.1 pili/flagellar assembly PapD-like chaperone [Chitinophaga ginsengisoli]
MRHIYYLIFVTILSPLLSTAQGNLLITPMRVVFEGQKKVQELNLANTGIDTARYLISLIEIRMNSNGTFERISEPDSGQLFASKFLRLFPRNVTLAPGEAQLVKVQLTKTGQLQDGEYRSHIYFRAVPDVNTQGEVPRNKDTSTISVKLIAVFGISIPVIIRVGPPALNVSLTDISLETKENAPPRLKMILRRTGNHSSYGDINIDYVSEKGKVTTVATVRGLAVYTPNPYRQFDMELEKKPGINYHHGKLRITYTAQSKGTVSDPLAETELQLH